MASEFGMFTPTEAAYTKPGGYESAQRGEAEKRGSWLAQLDQFYEELEQQKEYQDSMIELKQQELMQRERQYEPSYGGAGGTGGGAGGGYGGIMIGPSGEAMSTTRGEVGGYGQPWTRPLSSTEMAEQWNRQKKMMDLTGEDADYKFPWE